MAQPLPHLVSRPEGLFDAVTGARFVARDANYVLLATNAAGAVYHSTFEPGRYGEDCQPDAVQDRGGT